MATKTWNGTDPNWYTASDWSQDGDPSAQSGDREVTDDSITLHGAIWRISDLGQKKLVTENFTDTGALDTADNIRAVHIADGDPNAATSLTLGGIDNPSAASLSPFGSANYAATPEFRGNSGSRSTGDSGSIAPSDSDPSTFTNSVTDGLLRSTAAVQVSDTGQVLNATATTTATDPPTLTTLLVFNITDGAEPVGGLIADAAEDLFGTTVESREGKC